MLSNGAGGLVGLRIGCFSLFFPLGDEEDGVGIGLGIMVGNMNYKHLGKMCQYWIGGGNRAEAAGMIYA